MCSSCDIIHVIIKQIMISCMIPWILYDIMIMQESLDYDFIHDIFVLILTSYMISYMILSKFLWYHTRCIWYHTWYHILYHTWYHVFVWYHITVATCWIALMVDIMCDIICDIIHDIINDITTLYDTISGMIS